MNSERKPLRIVGSEDTINSLSPDVRAFEHDFAFIVSIELVHGIGKRLTSEVDLSFAPGKLPVEFGGIRTLLYNARIAGNERSAASSDSDAADLIARRLGSDHSFGDQNFSTIVKRFGDVDHHASSPSA